MKGLVLQKAVIDHIKSLNSIPAVEMWVVQNQELLGLYGMRDFKLEEMSFGKQSITHYAPRGHLTNWSGRNGDRRHHYGWYGRLHVCFDHETDRFMGLSRAIALTGVHVGTGGGWQCPDRKCDVHFSWDTTMFALDFPKIAVRESFSGRVGDSRGYTGRGLDVDFNSDRELLATLFPDQDYYAKVCGDWILLNRYLPLRDMPKIGNGFLASSRYFEELVALKMQGEVLEINSLHAVEEQTA